MEQRPQRNDLRPTDCRDAIVALLVVQILLGYEWLASGLTKVVHGDFPAGLAGDLAERSHDASGWYRSFLDTAVIPHAHAFGYAIEISELLAGLALVAVAALRLRTRDRLDERAWRTALVTTVAAALAGALMNVNFLLASGSPLPGPVAADSFDEAIGLDTLMAAVELVLIAVGVMGLRRASKRHRPRPARELNDVEHPARGSRAFSGNPPARKPVGAPRRP